VKNGGIFAAGPTEQGDMTGGYSWDVTVSNNGSQWDIDIELDNGYEEPENCIYVYIYIHIMGERMESSRNYCDIYTLWYFHIAMVKVTMFQG
jgi:hypothetical protein